MKAAFKGSEKIFIKNIKAGQLEPNEIRVKVDACGVCGTDLHFEPTQNKPQRFGHEIAGTILELGNAVKHLEIGQKIALDSATPCGFCTNCKNGEQELCTDIKSIFFKNEMGFAEEVISPAICTIPYKNISPEVASLQEPLGVAIDMVRLTDIKPGANVLLMGAGPIGLMALVLAKLQGAAKVYVCQRERRKKRLKIAEKWGAEAIISPEELGNYNFNGKIDRIMVTTPPDTLPVAIKIACKGAIITFIGLGHGKDDLCSFEGNAFHFKKLQLRASFASPALFGPMAVEYLENGIIKGEELVSHTFPLDQLEEAMEVAKNDSDAVKVVISNKK